MVEGRSKFRVIRIPLEPRQIYAYYGIDASDTEECNRIESCASEANTSSKETENTSYIPSFHCSMPNSPFHSTFNESTATTNFGQNRTSAVSTQVPTPTLNVPQSPFCSTYYDDTNDLASQQERKSTETRAYIDYELYAATPAAKTENRISTATSVIPSFQCDLAKSLFCSTYTESQSDNAAFSSQDQEFASQTTTVGDSQAATQSLLCANTRKSFACSNRMSVMSAIPSFHCDLPNSPFYSSYKESQPQFGGSQDVEGNSQKTAAMSMEKSANATTLTELMDVVSEENAQQSNLHSPSTMVNEELLENGDEEMRNADADSGTNGVDDIEANVRRLLTNRYSTKFSNTKHFDEAAECVQPEKSVRYTEDSPITKSTAAESVVEENLSSSSTHNVESVDLVEIDRNLFGASRVSFGSAWKSLADIGNTLASDSEYQGDVSGRGAVNRNESAGGAVSPRSQCVWEFSQKKDSLASRNSALGPSLREYAIEDSCGEQQMTREYSPMDYSIIKKPASTRNSTIYESSLSTQDESTKRSITPVVPTIRYIVPKTGTAQNPVFKENGELNAIQRRMTANFVSSFQPPWLVSEALQDGQKDLQKDVEVIGESPINYSVHNAASTRSSTIYESSPTAQDEASKRSMTPVVPTIQCIVPKTAQNSVFKENDGLNAVQRRMTASHFMPFFQPSKLVNESVLQDGRMDLQKELESENAEKSLRTVLKRPQNFSRNSIALREIIFNYATPPSTSRNSAALHRKSMTRKGESAAVKNSMNATGDADDGKERYEVLDTRCRDSSLSSPSSKQIVLRRSSSLISRLSAVDDVTNSPKAANNNNKASNFVVPSPKVIISNVVGCVEDGSFALQDSRDSFFSEIDNLSPIKGAIRDSRVSALSRRSLNTVTSTPDFVHAVSPKADMSATFPRGKIIDDSYGDFYNGTNSTFEGSDNDVPIEELSHCVEEMALDNSYAGGDDINSSQDKMSNRRNSDFFTSHRPSTSFDQLIFTTGLNDISDFNMINSSLCYADGEKSGYVVDSSMRNDDSSVFDGGRRESCATCAPNTDHIVMSGEIAPSPVYVLPPPKILHNNENSPSVEAGLRRSKRNRLPRLNIMQRPIYERDEDGNLNLVGATEAIVKDKMLKKYRVSDPIAAAEKDHEMKKRKMLEREKKKLLRTCGY